MTQTLPSDDPYQWLEEIDSERALAWVEGRNSVSQRELTGQPEYAELKPQILDVLNASDRIPYVVRRGEWFYNLWQDQDHKRGLWRRTTLDEYRKPAPDWETVLDLDELSLQENENWVWAGAHTLGPDHRHCLIQLSRGGADAVVVREFDTVSKIFLTYGFVLPEAKSSVDWIDADTIYVSTYFGEGSLTDSGYPRIIKRWQRGKPLAEAVTVFEGATTDVAVSVWVDHTPGFERTVFTQSIDFYNAHTFVLHDDDTLLALDVPTDSSPHFVRDQLLLRLRSPLTVAEQNWPAGSLLIAKAAAWQGGDKHAQAIFTPSATRSLADYTLTRDTVLLNVLDNVAGKLEIWRQDAAGHFRGEAVDAPFPGTLGVGALHDPQLAEDPLAEHYLLSYTDFLTPDSLYLASTDSAERECLKARTTLFGTDKLRVEQRFAVSADGTRIPYFLIGNNAASGTPQPTLLYGYGGFEVSLEPWYSAVYGRAWLDKGAQWVVANIRGGGEFGPDWHRSAIRENKHRSYDDFIAVAEDLIDRGVTSPEHLGIMGGSNGGLLVGATFTQRPELFNAVVCSVPLLDMRRYHTLLAGASWMAEYGNPDLDEDWAFMSRYSPYQNLQTDSNYPEVLFTTSTRDDRVHPAHARKMAARMLALGHPVLYYENIEGGHGGAADNEQRAHLLALEFSYLWRQLR
ncbi:prolyl oligopeptidase family serine peptidase [Silvimonas soli]|uniref:prolyl oligopeptidase family serine peptidase n=1 Tax=Silvimonas soli TaxID=2980100 RepID=UPI0024B351BD|nr:prolyl oligopeptidase family serine peptidase [Silvimonas soli]